MANVVADTVREAPENLRSLRKHLRATLGQVSQAYREAPENFRQLQDLKRQIDESQRSGAGIAPGRRAGTELDLPPLTLAELSQFLGRLPGKAADFAGRAAREAPRNLGALRDALFRSR